MPPGRVGCVPHTQQMKPNLIACILGSTSNFSALGEEKLQIQLAFCPWHAEPGESYLPILSNDSQLCKRDDSLCPHCRQELQERPSRVWPGSYSELWHQDFGVFSVPLLERFKQDNLPPDSQKMIADDVSCF